MKEEVVVDRVQWARVKEFVKSRFGEYPSVTTALFIIGLQEIGKVIPELSKEEKQEVIHVGVCAVMARDGFYKKTHVDENGWPHYEALTALEDVDIDNQENLLKQSIIKYFQDVL